MISLACNFTFRHSSFLANKVDALVGQYRSPVPWQCNLVFADCLFDQYAETMTTQGVEVQTKACLLRPALTPAYAVIPCPGTDLFVASGGFSSSSRIEVSSGFSGSPKFDGSLAWNSSEAHGDSQAFSGTQFHDSPFLGQSFVFNMTDPDGPSEPIARTGGAFGESGTWDRSGIAHLQSAGFSESQGLNDDQASAPDSGQLPLILGIALGLFFLLIVIVAGAIYYRQRQLARNRDVKEDSDDHMPEFFDRCRREKEDEMTVDFQNPMFETRVGIGDDDDFEAELDENI
jgi:hypothetical protein